MELLQNAYVISACICTVLKEIKKYQQEINKESFICVEWPNSTELLYINMDLETVFKCKNSVILHAQIKTRLITVNYAKSEINLE